MSESIRSIPNFVTRAAGLRRRAARPTAREWARHALLFLLTGLTMTWAGMSFVLRPDAAEPNLAAPATPLEYLLYVPQYYVLALAAVASYALAHPTFIADGLKFAASLLAILLAHESGHYIACRLYGVDATLPFFIPMPPPFLVGTLGAFIKIKSPIPSRRALFDIGVAGPLAGFLVLIPVAVVGLLTSVPAPPMPSEGIIIFNDPPLLRLLAKLLGVRDLAGIVRSGSVPSRMWSSTPGRSARGAALHHPTGSPSRNARNPRAVPALTSPILSSRFSAGVRSALPTCGSMQ